MILVVHKCGDCPLMHREKEAMLCRVAAPGNRPIPPDSDRPTWCPLRKEQVILRQFQ